MAGIKYIHMKSLIEFIYNGEVNIYQDHLAELLRVANILKIKGLDEMPPAQMTEGFETKQQDDCFNNASNPSNSGNSSEMNLVPAIKISDTRDSSHSNAPSTSDPTKTTTITTTAAKKRKSVSFSDTPEIVCDQSNDSYELWPTSSGNGKRKSRSLPDVCSITKVKKDLKEIPPPDEDDDDDDVGDNDNNDDDANKTKLVVTINPHSLYSSSESIDTMNQSTGNNSLRQQRPSRKMIRKNENFLRALEAVRDEGIGFCKAAKIHGVNNRTLWLEYQKRGYPMKNARKKTQT